MDINSVIIEGRLTKEVNAVSDKLRTFSIAVNKYAGKDENGENRYETSFFEVKCFNKNLFSMLDKIAKGTKVTVQGSLDQDKWEGKDGSKNTRNVIALQNISTPSGAQGGNSQGRNNGNGSYSRPTQTQKKSRNDYEENYGDDSDVPF